MEEKNILFINRNNHYEKYDFNLYPIYLVCSSDQLFITPTGECYVVRKSDTEATGVSHLEFAKMLVNSQIFASREMEEIRKNPNAKCWKDEKEYVDEGYEIQYLVNEKGFILYSPPTSNEISKFSIPRLFFPQNLSLLTKQQIHNFLYLYETEGTMMLPDDFEETLYQMIVTKQR